MKCSVALGVALLCAPALAEPPAGENSSASIADIQISTPSSHAVGLSQIAPTAADLGRAEGRRIPQAVEASTGRSPVPQMQHSAATTDVRVANVPPEMVDACTEAALGRRAPPKGIDCTKVLEANPRPSTSDLSGGEPLVAGVRGAGNEVSIRRLEDADPEEIARRLASGYLVNAPAAQAVGAGAPQQPPTGGVLVIPDPSRSPGAPPPVVVNPNPQ